MPDNGFRFKLRFEASKLKMRLEDLPASSYRRLRKAFTALGADFLRRLKTERLAGRPGLNKRTGDTARNWDIAVTGETLDELALTIVKKAPHIWAHEAGAVIRPTKGKYLAIPLGAAKTAAGVSRGGPREYDDLFFIRSKKGNLLLVRRKGKGIEPMFLLRTEVRIPARLGARELLKDVITKRRSWISNALAGKKIEKE